MRLSEITSNADKLRLYHAKKAAAEAKHKAAQEQYRQRMVAYANKASKPIKAGQKPPQRPIPPKPPVFLKPPQDW